MSLTHYTVFNLSPNVWQSLAFPKHTKNIQYTCHYIIVIVQIFQEDYNNQQYHKEWCPHILLCAAFCLVFVNSLTGKGEQIFPVLRVFSVRQYYPQWGEKLQYLRLSGHELSVDALWIFECCFKGILEGHSGKEWNTSKIKGEWCEFL